ncbi:MAG: amidoligase family protein [Bacilli bacterium]|nr:amidoligase family protein [Bacilli bacterium]
MRENINISNDIKFGCEIEFNSPYNIKEINTQKNKINSEFKIEYDSCISNIKEAISPILTVEKINELKQCLELINMYKGYIKGNEGAHIHFDSSIVSKENFSTMLKMWYLSEPVIYEFSKCDCDKLRKDYYTYAHELGNTLKSLIKCYDNRAIGIGYFRTFHKNNGLNLYNYVTNNCIKNTLEVRTPNGTLNYEIWLNNIEFFASLFMYCNNIENKELIEYLFKKDEFLNSDELSNMIFNNDESKYYFNKQLNGEYGKEKKMNLY